MIQKLTFSADSPPKLDGSRSLALWKACAVNIISPPASAATYVCPAKALCLCTSQGFCSAAVLCPLSTEKGKQEVNLNFHLRNNIILHSCGETGGNPGFSGWLCITVPQWKESQPVCIKLTLHTYCVSSMSDSVVLFCSRRELMSSRRVRSSPWNEEHHVYVSVKLSDAASTNIINIALYASWLEYEKFLSHSNICIVFIFVMLPLVQAVQEMYLISGLCSSFLNFWND